MGKKASAKRSKRGSPTRTKKAKTPAKSKKKVSTKKLDKVRKLLIQKRAHLMKHLGMLDDDEGLDASNVGDIVDVAVFQENRTVRQGLQEAESEQLRQINEALEKIEKGSYGICTDCGRPIEPARLEAIPHALNCVKCKSEKERSIKAGGGW